MTVPPQSDDAQPEMGDSQAGQRAALDAAELLRQDFFERHPLPMWFFDAETLEFLAVNAAAVRQYGYTEPEFLQMTINDLRPAAEVQRLLNDAAKNENVSDEAPVRHHRKKDGSVIEVRVVSHEIAFRGRRAKAVLATDITEPRRAQAERDAMLDRLQLQFERMPVACILHDTDFHITDWNPAAEQLFGFSKAEALGNSPYQLIVPDTAHEDVRRLETRIRQGEPAVTSINENCTKDGKRLWCEWHNTPLVGRNGAYLGLMAMARDITHLRQAEDELRALNESLERRVAARTAELITQSKSKDELLGTVAHDLKNPLTHISLAVQLLRLQAEGRLPEKLTPEKLLKRIDQIEDALERMQALINTLLSQHALDAGMTLSPEPVDAAEVLRQVADRYIDAAARKNLELLVVTGAASTQDATALADRYALIQTLDNLISNAVKYSPAGKRIFLRAYSLLHRVRIEVQDEGQGISAEDMQKLFGKYQRLSAKPTGGENSTGLGLSIAKRLVEAMDGDIFCRSEIGRGATFVVDLPRFSADE